ncbi:MAG: ATP-binding protein, partial [Actinomycetota bacterium]
MCTAVGPAGIGKTEILRQVRAEWQASGRNVVRIVGTELEQGDPLGGVRQLLDQVGDTLPSPAPPTGLRPDHGPAGGGDSASRLRTDTGADTQTGTDTDTSTHPNPEPDIGANVERHAAALVLRHLDDLADRNTLLVIDDAHWLDETSRRVVDFALRRLDDQAPPTLIAERPSRSMSSTGERLVLGGLSPDETACLVEERAAPRTVEAATIHEHADGNPLTVLELLSAAPRRSGDEPSPKRSLIRSRIDGLDRPSQLALTMLARRRRGDDLDAAWAHLAETETGTAGIDDLVTALAPAIDAELVDQRPGAVEPTFVHPVYRLRASTGVAGRALRPLSEGLAVSTPDVDSAAWHRADAISGRSDETADLLAACARRMTDRGTPIEAARAHEAAAALAVDPNAVIDRRIDAAACWWFAGEPTEVARVTADCDEMPVDQLRRLQARRLHRAAVGWHGQVISTIRGYLDDADIAADHSLEHASETRLLAYIESLHAGRID